MGDVRGFYQEFTIGATEAALLHPALIIDPNGFRWVDVDAMKVTNDYQSFDNDWPVRLKAISCCLVISTQVVRLGWRLYPIVLTGSRSLAWLPTSDPVQGLLNRGMSWAGDIPIYKGFGVMTYDTLTATDRFIVSALYEV